MMRDIDARSSRYGCAINLLYQRPVNFGMRRPASQHFSCALALSLGATSDFFDMLSEMWKIVGLITFTALFAFGQVPADTWAAESGAQYNIRPNVVYGNWSGYEARLDVYQRRGVTTPQPTLIFIHGGGWVLGTKESAVMSFLPWLQMGWNVINVEYRLSHVALAPAAVEDCLCALKFVVAHARDYNVDPSRIVTSGESAGGHLALTTGMIPDSVGLDRQCPGINFLGRGAGVP